MEVTIIELKKLIASEGMTLTNGETFSKSVYLGINDSVENWHEITDAEAEKLQAAEETNAEVEV